MTETDRKNEIYRQRIEAARDAAWQGFMAQPMTRLAMSLVPAGDHRDALPLVLRAAFDAGFYSGEAAFGLEVLTKFLDRKPGDQR